MFIEILFFFFVVVMSIFLLNQVVSYFYILGVIVNEFKRVCEFYFDKKNIKYVFDGNGMINWCMLNVVCE